MTISDGFTPIPPGKIAAIVTVLEMHERPPAASVLEPEASWSFARVESPDVGWYEDLYRRIGAAHLWYSRLEIARDALAETIGNECNVIHAFVCNDVPEGLVEIDFSQDGVAEIVFFGVTPSFIGRKAARFMMGRSIDFAFSRGIARLWLHTNTNDHPNALAFYRRSGFTPVRQMVEIADDPRLGGAYAEDIAPNVPIFGK